MSDQEPGRVNSSEDQDCDENRPAETRGITNYEMPIIFDQEILWHQNATTSSSFCIEEAHEAAHYSILEYFSRFEVPSPLLQEVNLGEIPCSDDIVLNTLEEGQSSGTERKHASDFLVKQTNERDLQEDGVKEDADASDQSKPQRRTRSAELHNQNERIRRQKLKEKMKTLQELIPNCNKRDKSCTLDDAIKYIKTLQYQIQMMSMGGYPTHHSPVMMMPQPNQRAQLPTLAPFPQAGPPIGGRTGMKHEIGMGMSSMLPWLDTPMSQVGLPNPSLMPSRLPPPGEGTSAAAQNPGNFLEQFNYTSSSMDWTPFDATSSGFQSTAQGVTSPSSQAATSEQSGTRGDSTARVLPTKIVLPRFNNEVNDCGSRHSASTEWSSGSTAK